MTQLHVSVVKYFVGSILCYLCLVDTCCSGKPTYRIPYRSASTRVGGDWGVPFPNRVAAFWIFGQKQNQGMPAIENKAQNHAHIKHKPCKYINKQINKQEIPPVAPSWYGWCGVGHVRCGRCDVSREKGGRRGKKKATSKESQMREISHRLPHMV